MLGTQVVSDTTKENKIRFENVFFCLTEASVLYTTAQPIQSAINQINYY